ncbi:MAG: hypothetical protein IJS82_00355 [Paludibacteraceae bacterium]|nr:hypothetical protein [Paludibacteraceae bacterium]
MKRIFLLAFAACSMSLMAQHVTPLNIQITELKLDSLRQLYQAEPTMYRAALNVVAANLDKNEDEIKAAKNQLKTEQAHAKEVEATLKDASQLTSALSKLYSKEQSELKTMQKSVEKQQRTLNKHKELNKDTREGYLLLLEKEQKELSYALREVDDRQRAISEMETTLRNARIAQDDFVHEIEQKAADLAQLEAKLKERVAIIKAEQKSAKVLK